MPHSVSPEDPQIPDQDAIHHSETDNDNGDSQTTNGTAVADSEAQNGESQPTEALDQDMTMADVGVQGAEVPQVTVKAEIRSEVKLEDLFADIDSDDEFPSSTGQNIKVSSSPEAPSSPVYVPCYNIYAPANLLEVILGLHHEPLILR